MANRILTTHVGSLPRPQNFSTSAKSGRLARSSTRPSYEAELKNAVAEVVQPAERGRRQI